MKNPCSLLLTALLGATLSLGLTAQAAELTWHTDMTKARETAKAQNKAVLVDFTGSDWCGYCIKLDKEVFATKDFAEFAAKNLVLVKADFPRKTKLDPALVKSNAALQKKYADPFQGYPTVVLVDASGKKLGEKVGYAPGSGPAAYLKDINGMLQK